MRSLVQRHQHERGFALLLVFAMAATVALLLYMELPRAVFESQRNKEEMLVERGEEYKMGLRRYYFKFRKMPNTLDELENTNGQRFLRKRYKDPFTGKDEWKIIKMDAAGNLIDSVQSKKSVTDKDGEKKGSTGSVSQGYSVSDSSQLGQQAEGTNVALQRRSSDRGIGADLATQQYQQRDGPDTGNPSDPNNPPVTTVNIPQPPPVPGQPQFQQFPGQQQQFPGQQQQQQFPGQSPMPGQPGFSPGAVPIPGQGFPPGTLPPGLSLPGMVPQPGGMPPAGFGQQPASPGSFGRPGFNPLQGAMPPGMGVATNQGQQQQPAAFGATPNNPSSNAAVQGILSGLTNPRPGMNVGQPGMFGAGGIAGFASKHKGEGIKLIEERSKINEWEFIYDPRKDKRVVGNGAMGTPQQPGGNPLGSSPGSPLGSSPGGQTPRKTPTKN